jgi:hypothetical protein
VSHFDAEAADLCAALKARTLLLVVVQGEKGSGVSVTTRQPQDREWIIEALRRCALDLEINPGTFRERVVS